MTANGRSTSLASCFRTTVVAGSLAAVSGLAFGPGPEPPAYRLKVVGGLAGVTQYRLFEEPFWARELPRLTNGTVQAEIVPVDRAGLRGQDSLRLLELGTVAFATVLLNVHPARDLQLAAPDLTLANPDFASLRRAVAAFRPHLARRLRERYGAELLAVYTYPAQTVFCTRPIAGLADLRGRRVRTSNVSQADMVEALGGTPVPGPFAEIVDRVRGGELDCAITGAMSGRAIGLDRATGWLLDTPLGWGVAAFAVNAAFWRTLPAPLRALLVREIAGLEERVWQEAERETGEGAACVTGAGSCPDGRPGTMRSARPEPKEAATLRHALFEGTILPRWLQRCGPDCAGVWAATVAPVVAAASR